MKFQTTVSFIVLQLIKIARGEDSLNVEVGKTSRLLRLGPPPTAPPSGVKGDPHFRTWNGESYDFHGVCDLVLVHNAGFGGGIGMDIHVRTEKMKMWSYVSSAAIRIGEDVLQVMGGVDMNFWINGIKGEPRSTKSKQDRKYAISNISGYPIYVNQESGKQDEFVIDLGDNQNIVIGSWHLLVRVSFKNMRNGDFKDSTGLMGSFPGGIKLARDNSTIIEDHNMFGQEWQVLDSEPKLFNNIEGPQHPSKCKTFSLLEMRRRLGESKLTFNEVEKICNKANLLNEAEVDLCIFDVLATNNKFTAEAYYQ